MSDTVRSSNRGRTIRAAAPFIAGALVLGACSKSSPPVNENTGAANTSAPAAGGNAGGNTNGTNKSTGTTQNSAKSLNTKVWSDGFEYDLGGVTYNQSDGKLTIDVTITNLGTDNATPYTDLSLLSGDSSVSSSGTLTDRKEIVGGKNVKDTITFDVDAGFDPSTTTVVFGGQNKQQAKVPLSGTGTKVTLAPVAQNVQLPDPMTIGTMAVTGSTVQIRYDDPDSHTTADKGKAFVVITGNAKNASTDQTNYWDTGSMQLTGPDNQTYVADSVTPSSLGPTKSGQTVMIWTIDDPNVGQLSGDYKLDIKDQTFGTNGDKVSLDTVTMSLSDKPSESDLNGTSDTTPKGTTTTTG
jgi:hypothetical protein